MHLAPLQKARLFLSPPALPRSRLSPVCVSAPGVHSDFVDEHIYPSGRSIRRLSKEALPKPQRTVKDLDPELVKQLVDKYVSFKSLLKLGKRGVTEQVASDIHQRWNTHDVVKVDADHKSLSGDTKQTAEDLERVSGGIVIWRSGRKFLLYKDPEKWAGFSKTLVNTKQSAAQKVKEQIEANLAEIEADESLAEDISQEPMKSNSPVIEEADSLTGENLKRGSMEMAKQ